MQNKLSDCLDKNYKLAIFDMDGTILNTLEDLADSANYTLKTYGMPQRTIEEIRKFVGNGIRRLLEQAVPNEISKELLEEMTVTFSSYYKEHCSNKTCAYEGIIEVLKEIRNKGIITAVVSNKADFGVQILCEEYFTGLFDFSVGEKQGIRRKPYPDSVLSVIDKFKISKNDVVYIGDSEVDLKTAVNAGIDVIMVGWGFRDEEYLKKCGAPFVINKPIDIMNFFR